MMVCANCRAQRPVNDAPCPQCGAPSPLSQGMSQAGLPSSPVWGGSPSTFAQNGSQWNNVGPSQSAWGNSSSQWNNPSQMPSSTWGGPVTSEPANMWEKQAQGQPGSMLPVPYQGQGWGGTPQALMPLREESVIQVPPPDTGESPIYVPPMYTKPRAIIPRYRAISGLLSVLIVGILLCAGAGYYAQASGKIRLLRQWAGMVPPQSMSPTAPPALADPPQAQYTPPASNIITSATTASEIDPGTGIALRQSQVFKPAQTIYLTWSVVPKTKGYVVVKWYTNDILYTTEMPTPPNGMVLNQTNTAYQAEAFPQPLSGKVELYWNDTGKDQLAITLYFVVR